MPNPEIKKATSNEKQLIISQVTEKFPTLRANKFDNLDKGQQARIHIFLKNAFIRAYSQIKKIDETYMLKDFYREFSLFFHPDKLSGQSNQVLSNLGCEPFKILSNLNESGLVFLISGDWTFEPIDIIDIYYQNLGFITQLNEWNQSLATELNQYTLGRYLTTWTSWMIQTPIKIIQGFILIPYILNCLITIFTFTIFMADIYFQEYQQNAFERYIKKHLANEGLEPTNMGPEQTEQYIDFILLNEQLEAKCQVKDPSFLKKTKYKLFDIFESFVEIYEIPGILPKEVWTFDYVYEHASQYHGIIEHLEKSSSIPANFKQQLMLLISIQKFANFDASTQEIPDFETLNLDTVFQILKNGGVKITPEEIALARKESLQEHQNIITIFEMISDRFYAYSRRWEDFKKNYDSLSDNDKKSAFFEWLELGVLAFINESIFAIVQLTVHILEFSLQLSTFVIFSLVALPIKLVNLFQKFNETQTSHEHQENRLIIFNGRA